MKSATYTHIIRVIDVQELWKRAAQQGKEPVYIVCFESAGLRLRGVIERMEGL